MCMVKFNLPCKNVDKCKILMVYTLFSGGEKSSDNADEISLSKMDDTDILSKKDTRSEETQTDKKLVLFVTYLLSFILWFS